MAFASYSASVRPTRKLSVTSPFFSTKMVSTPSSATDAASIGTAFSFANPFRRFQGQHDNRNARQSPAVTMSPPRIPKTLRAHGIEADEWQLGDGRFAFDYMHAGIRCVVKCRDFDALRREFEDYALKKADGETQAFDMTDDERRNDIAARDVLAPHGLRVDDGATDFAEALTISGATSARELALSTSATTPPACQRRRSPRCAVRCSWRKPKRISQAAPSAT